MAKAKKFDLEAPASIPDEEDEEALAAIDEGIRDAKSSRTVPVEEVRKRLPRGISTLPLSRMGSIIRRGWPIFAGCAAGALGATG